MPLGTMNVDLKIIDINSKCFFVLQIYNFKHSSITVQILSEVKTEKDNEFVGHFDGNLV